jgi:hypothetical protein
MTSIYGCVVLVHRDVISHLDFVLYSLVLYNVAWTAKSSLSDVLVISQIQERKGSFFRSPVLGCQPSCEPLRIWSAIFANAIVNCSSNGKAVVCRLLLYSFRGVNPGCCCWGEVPIVWYGFIKGFSRSNMAVHRNISLVIIHLDQRAGRLAEKPFHHHLPWKQRSNPSYDS